MTLEYEARSRVNKQLVLLRNPDSMWQNTYTFFSRKLRNMTPNSTKQSVESGGLKIYKTYSTEVVRQL